MAKEEVKQEASMAPAPREYSTVREYFVTTVVCTIFALFVTTYVVHPMTVPTPSMVPTIEIGDRLLIDKFTIRNGFTEKLPLSPYHEVKRGDILVFKYPEEPEVLYVKRLIGLSGETIEIRDKQVHVDGKAIDEPYKFHKDEAIFSRNGPHSFLSGIKRDNFGPVLVPADSFFMMGDNRDDSADSRYFGFLEKKYVVGRPLLVFWSYADDNNAHLRSDIIRLYAERVFGFFSKTRWSRMGHIIR